MACLLPNAKPDIDIDILVGEIEMRQERDGEKNVHTLGLSRIHLCPLEQSNVAEKIEEGEIDVRVNSVFSFKFIVNIFSAVGDIPSKRIPKALALQSLIPLFKLIFDLE